MFKTLILNRKIEHVFIWFENYNIHTSPNKVSEANDCKLTDNVALDWIFNYLCYIQKYSRFFSGTLRHWKTYIKISYTVGAIWTPGDKVELTLQREKNITSNTKLSKNI